MADDVSISYLKSSASLTDSSIVFTHDGISMDKAVRQGSPYAVPYSEIVAVDFRAPNIAVNGYIAVATSLGLQPNRQRNPYAITVSLTSLKGKKGLEAFRDELMRRAGVTETTRFEYDGLFQGAPTGAVASAPGAVISQQGPTQASEELLDLQGAPLPVHRKPRLGDRGKLKALRKDYERSLALTARYQELIDQANTFSWTPGREATVFDYAGLSLLVPEATSVTRQSGRIGGQQHLGVGLGRVGVGFSSGQSMTSRSVTTTGPDQFQDKGVGTLRITTRGVIFSGASRVVRSEYRDLIDVTSGPGRVSFTDQRSQAVWAVSGTGDASSEIHGITRELVSAAGRVGAGSHLDQHSEARVREAAGLWAAERMSGQETARTTANNKYRALIAEVNERAR